MDGKLALANFRRPPIVYSILENKCLTSDKISAILYMSGEGKRFSEGEKNFEKKLKKPLTNPPKSDIINTKGEGHTTNQKGLPL